MDRSGLRTMGSWGIANLLIAAVLALHVLSARVEAQARRCPDPIWGCSQGCDLIWINEWCTDILCEGGVFEMTCFVREYVIVQAQHGYCNVYCGNLYDFVCSCFVV